MIIIDDKDKEKIKDLAQKALEEKWYKIRKGEFTDFNSKCSFCYDVEEKRKGKTFRSEDYCKPCYIEILIPGFCFGLEYRDINNIIETLEQLVKHGEL